MAEMPERPAVDRHTHVMSAALLTLALETPESRLATEGVKRVEKSTLPAFVMTATTPVHSGAPVYAASETK